MFEILVDNVEQGSPDPQILAQIVGALVWLLCGLQCKKSQKKFMQKCFPDEFSPDMFVVLWYYQHNT